MYLHLFAAGGASGHFCQLKVREPRHGAVLSWRTGVVMVPSRGLWMRMVSAGDEPSGRGHAHGHACGGARW